MTRLARLLVALLAGGVLVAVAQAAAAPAPPSSDPGAPSATAASESTATAARRRRHRRRPGCNRFCRQAGGFGGGPDTTVPVKMPRQTIRVDRDNLIGVRAMCTLETDCVGAVLVDSFHASYGRANLRIPAGATRTVYVWVPRKARRYLKRHGRDRTGFATVPLTAGDQPVSVSKRITLLPRR